MPQAPLKLSPHDQMVLESIFNPLELSGFQSNISVPSEADLTDALTEPETDVIRESRNLELQAVCSSEKGDIQEALDLFQKALELSERASVLNNRAQTLRLAKRDQEALDDLNRSLALATDAEVRTKCHAHCQRGVLYRKLENVDAARSDFAAAANLGSKFAKEQLVEINPFAALCNQMLRQAFEQLK